MYSTDSLLEELSNATTLTKLVLHGCDLITDAGIKQLESKSLVRPRQNAIDFSALLGLRYLEYLDVSNCKITDKGLKSITGKKLFCLFSLSPSLLLNRASFSRLSELGQDTYHRHWAAMVDYTHTLSSVLGNIDLIRVQGYSIARDVCIPPR